MNDNFSAFVALSRSIASDQQVAWDIPLSEEGKALRGRGWNLTQMVGGVVTPAHHLNHLGCDDATLKALAGQAPELSGGVRVLSDGWQNLIKAAVIEQLLVRKNSTGHVVNCVIRPLRVLATVARDKEPWEINSDDIAAAVKVAAGLQSCGVLGDRVAALAKILFDQNHLADAGPIYAVVASARLNPGKSRRAKFLKSAETIRSSLEERKRSERLPSQRAFWELIRIVMTEEPRSLVDELRFAAIRLMIVTGFRIGEATRLPSDWLRRRSHVSPSGAPASAFGGVDSTMMIRHFAEKQNTDGGSSLTLSEATAFVPRMFEDFLQETLGRVNAITEPLRKTLRAQVESGRLLPSFGATQLVPMLHLYPYLSGSPYWTEFDEKERESWRSTCRADVSGGQFDRLFELQVADFASGKRSISNAAYVYFNRMRAAGLKEGALYVRREDGSEYGATDRIRWQLAFFRIGELEEYLKDGKRTKASDVEPLRLEGGLIQTWDLMFLHPKRSLAEERNEGICDITRYASVNRPSPDFLTAALGESDQFESIFQRYGATVEDRSLVIRSHMLRHLLNNELYRLGVADTIITKQFNRRSVTQSYQYDHRSLAEDLNAIEIPEEVEYALGEKTSTVYKMIRANKSSGPIVDDFRRIQADEGEEAALTFLRAEADGFHATPYGTCVSSFTVSPCPKHLQCFAGCRHLTSSQDPVAHANLRKLEIKLVAAVDDIEERGIRNVGWQNQLDHARSTLQGVRSLLATEPGRAAFPDGKDYSKPEATDGSQK
ncbi:hypothetical protein [Dyella japonica]|nr:hypothetical protein [Dyella japonica]